MRSIPRGTRTSSRGGGNGRRTTSKVAIVNFQMPALLGEETVDVGTSVCCRRLGFHLCFWHWEESTRLWEGGGAFVWFWTHRLTLDRRTGQRVEKQLELRGRREGRSGLNGGSNL